MGKPIIALATPPLKGALAIIRCSGDGIFDLFEGVFSKSLKDIKERKILTGALYDNDHRQIDYVVLLCYPGPNSMTGEDVVEIIPHGSMVIVSQIIETLESRGFIYASRGEFSSRAFCNGKMDLIEAEAVNDLINATTIEGKNLALMSLSGKSSKLLEPILFDISSLLALIEVGIDFPEYDDIEKASEEKIVSICQKNIKAIDELIKNGREGRMVKEGVKVAIVGKPNVGKSSILNALLERDKAIVSDIAGTTRDIVEGEINIKGIPFLLFDTAGIHESNDFIEKIGVDKSIKSIEEADLVVLVKDSREPTLDEEEKTILEKAGDKAFVCLNKSDLNEANIPGYISISALNKDVDALKDKLIDSLSLSEGIFDTPSLSNARQLSLLKTIKDDLIKAKEDASNHEPMDFISVSIQSAYHKINELFGKECNNDISDEIFSRFCVGK